MSATELAVLAARAADEKAASDIVVLDVSAIIGICDVFVIASARNLRQVRAVAEEVEEQVYLLTDRRPISVEGLDARRWVLLDFGDVVVHVFLDEDREYYRLERLYRDAPPISWSGDGTPGLSA